MVLSRFSIIKEIMSYHCTEFNVLDDVLYVNFTVMKLVDFLIILQHLVAILILKV